MIYHFLLVLILEVNNTAPGCMKDLILSLGLTWDTETRLYIIHEAASSLVPAYAMSRYRAQLIDYVERSPNTWCTFVHITIRLRALSLDPGRIYFMCQRVSC